MCYMGKQQPGVSYVGCFVLVVLFVEFANCLKFGISHCVFLIAIIIWK